MKEWIFHFINSYGYIGLFISLILGIVGLPLPDEWLLAFSGYLVSTHRFHLLPVLLVSFLGSIGGMTLSFIIGHRFGVPLLEKHGSKVGLTPHKLSKVEYWFERFGKFTVTLGYFIPGVRHVTALSAGVSKWRYSTFILYAIPGAFLWVGTFVLLGVYMQEHWRVVAEKLHGFIWWAVVVVAALVLLGLWIRKIRARRGKHNGDS